MFCSVAVAAALRQIKSSLNRPTDVARSTSLRHLNFTRSASVKMLAAASVTTRAAEWFSLP